MSFTRELLPLTIKRKVFVIEYLSSLEPQDTKTQYIDIFRSIYCVLVAILVNLKIRTSFTLIQNSHNILDFLKNLPVL